MLGRMQACVDIEKKNKICTALLSSSMYNKSINAHDVHPDASVQSNAHSVFLEAMCQKRLQGCLTVADMWFTAYSMEDLVHTF